jgi:hypothetical protein
LLVQDLLSLAETAEQLGTTVNHVRRLARTGHLKPIYLIGRRREAPRFRPEEVAALAEIRGQRFGLADVAALAKNSSIRTSVLERQLGRLTELLGLNVPVLGTSEPAIVRLYAEIETELSTEHPNITVESTMRWAQRFYAMGEEVFEAIALHTADPEPWQKPLRLATRLLQLKPRLRNPELDVAYQHLQVGRRFMRQAAYFYVRTQHGTRIAHRLFREVEGDINQQILSMVFATQP